MAQNFMWDTRDHKFILKEWLDMDKIFGFDRFNGVYSKDDIDAILAEAVKVAKDVIAPSQDDNDAVGAVFKDGKVTVPESFKKAYWFVQENGWGSCNADHHYEGALPKTLYTAVAEALASANAGLAPYYMATAGSAELIQDFGNDHLKELFLPKMFSGEWAGTMDLTEPNGGSDVGDLLTRAFPTDTPGLYKIRGSKCFITGGEQDITENIIHLTLARVEGARPGTSGISLFVVPKFWVNEDGSLGKFNDLNCIGIEHKMGIKGSATASLAFGEENECYGWILGDPPGEDGKGQGMAQMFNMMNTERATTGTAALAESTVAYHNAVQYATERIQGRPLTNPKAGRVQIIKHEDVRRMLLDIKAHLDAMRALSMKTYYYMDIIINSKDPEEVKQADWRYGISTPLCKAYLSDMAWILTAEAMQVYGGYGYSEENPIAQLVRDVKIYSIWEGTNYIQSMDLVGRKWMQAKGQAFNDFLGDIFAFLKANADNQEFARELEILNKAIRSYNEIRKAIQEHAMGGKIGFIGLYATRILHATAKLYCGYLLLDQALLASQRIKELGEDHFDYAFYKGKVESAKYYLRNIVPEIFTVTELIKVGDSSAIDIPEESFQF
ncbi:MAG TPA: acyl-CoA dehydrogenase [Syntrophomonas sp.]|nr:acyl-CoA dehydrogenase [Syntrophomonas sp.]